MTISLFIIAALVWVVVAAVAYSAKKGPLVMVGGGFLAACVALGAGAFITKTATELTAFSPELAADTIIKRSIKTPGTYRRLSSEQVWSGKTASGYTAYVMKVEFDAQNEFGALLRQRWLVAFHTEGENFAWKGPFATGDLNDWDPSNEDGLIRFMVEHNFQ